MAIEAASQTSQSSQAIKGKRHACEHENTAQNHVAALILAIRHDNPKDSQCHDNCESHVI